MKGSILHKAVIAAIFGILALDVTFFASVGWVLAASRCPLDASKKLLANPYALADMKEQYQSQTHLVKTEDGLDLISAPPGEFWVVHRDAILPLLLAEQRADIYEPPGHEVRSGDIVLDCGANIGAFSRTALSRGASLVVAIEPAPQTLKALRRNLEPEIRSGRVIVYPKGVWDHDDELALSLDDANEGNNSVVMHRDSRATVKVPLTTIDKIVTELKLPRVDFIKMDIEGAEKNAIAGGSDTIRKFRPRMSVSSEHLKDDYTAIPAAVKSIEPNYRFTRCDCELSKWRIYPLVLAFDPVR